jgi:hypothetical protein
MPLMMMMGGFKFRALSVDGSDAESVSCFIFVSCHPCHPFFVSGMLLSISNMDANSVSAALPLQP